MTSNDEFSLREVLKKRKLQRTTREINTPSTKSTPPISSSLPKPIPPIPATQMAKIAAASSRQAVSKHGFGQTVEEVIYAAKDFMQRYPRITLLAVVGCILVCLSVLVVVSLPRAQPPTLVDLPLVNADDVINHLRTVGLPLGKSEPYADGSKWSAATSIRFDVSDKGYVVVLSYADQPQTNDNAFKLQFAPEYAEWRQFSLTNIIVLASPEVSEALYHDITNNLVQYLVVPYRPEMLRN